MTKFFSEKILDREMKAYTFTGDESRYLMDVLRSKPGETVILCDGSATDYTLEILSLSKQEVQTKILSSERNNTEPPYKAVLYQALAKGDKMDLIIQKSVELGVSRIVPVLCERSVVRIDIRDSEKKRERWQKIALEAARQSGRGIVPEVSLPVRFSEALQSSLTEADLVFIPWEGERSKPLSETLENFLASDRFSRDIAQSDALRPDIRFFIGPEGGFSPTEIELAQTCHIQTVSLGKRILRTETAGLFVLSSLVYRLEAI